MVYISLFYFKYDYNFGKFEIKFKIEKLKRFNVSKTVSLTFVYTNEKLVNLAGRINPLTDFEKKTQST